MKKILGLLLLTLILAAGVALFNHPLVQANDVPIVTPPSVRLTSMCYEGDGVGLMRLREENGGDYTIVWSDNDVHSGEFKAGETIFFDVTSPKTIIVNWYDKDNAGIHGSTTKAQNTKACTVVTICYQGETKQVIQDKGLPAGAVEGECEVVVTPTPTPTPTPTTNVGGPGDGKSDGLGCGSNDCSGNPTASQGQVLGASTKAVLGLSATSGDSTALLSLIQLAAAFGFTSLGFGLFRKHV